MKKIFNNKITENQTDLRYLYIGNNLRKVKGNFVYEKESNQFNAN